MSNQSMNCLDEPRDERGRWTAGGATLASDRRPESAPATPPEPAPDFGNRQDYVRANAIGHLAPDVRARMEAILARGADVDLRFALRALASPLDTEGSRQPTLGQVRAKFGLPDRISDSVLGDLRDAAKGARKAVTAEQMDTAATALARALTTLGTDNAASVLRAIKEAIDQANLRQLAQILQNEAGEDDERVSMAPIGRTLLNRMTRNDTVLVSDVASAYAHPRRNQIVAPETVAVARTLLDGTSQDPTNGATHFYSPRFQPHEGERRSGFDTSGGIEAIPGFVDPSGKQIKNYRPAWTRQFDLVDVPSVPPTVAKFYKKQGTGHVR